MTENLKPLEGIVITGDDAGALVTVSGRSPLDLFTAPGVVPALLDAIRQEATRDFTPDLSTDRGRKEIASRAFKVAKSKTYLDDLGKEEVARLKDLPRQVDAGRKALRDGLDALRDDIRRPLTEWEERRERLQARLNELRNLPARLFQADSAAIRAAIEGLDDQVGAPGPAGTTSRTRPSAPAGWSGPSWRICWRRPRSAKPRPPSWSACARRRPSGTGWSTRRSCGRRARSGPASASWRPPPVKGGPRGRIHPPPLPPPSPPRCRPRRRTPCAAGRSRPPTLSTAAPSTGRPWRPSGPPPMLPAKLPKRLRPGPRRS